MLTWSLFLAIAPFIAPALAAPSSSPLDLIKRAEPHEVAALLNRRAPDPSDPNFASNYPPTFQAPTGSRIPSAWMDKLRSLTLPPVNQASGNGFPNYNGQNGGDSTVCSFTYGCSAPSDLKDPRSGWIGLTFDDGPAGGSDDLMSFLTGQNASTRATHFMIGSYIVNNPSLFQRVAQGGGHIAVHTWSHQYMTTLSNEQIVGELGWTMQIEADLNGGRIPKYWRPPYGDVDNRVRAIAKGVFGLETVVWNQDTGDWNIAGGNNPAYTYSTITANFEGWLKGDKQYGLNVLEHELNSDTIAVFKTTYPKIAANGWNAGAIPDAFGGMDWYQNTRGSGNTGPVTNMDVLGGGGGATSSASSSTNSSSSSSAASATGNVSTTVVTVIATTSPAATTASNSPIQANLPSSSATSAAQPLFAVSALVAGGALGIASVVLLI